MFTRAVLPILLSAGLACSPPESPGSSGSVDDGESGILTSETPQGRQVTLTLDPDPPKEGVLALHFHLAADGIPGEDLSVDLVAPRMPAHGIRRFPAEFRGNGEWTSEVRIPMEGLWAVYLNLDWGEESAPFEFEVVGIEGEAYDHHPHDHHSASSHEHH